MAGCLSTAPVHYCKPDREQTGGIRGLCAVSRGSERRRWTAHRTGELPWMDTGSSGRVGWDSKVGSHPFSQRAVGTHGALSLDRQESVESLWVTTRGQTK